jgi:hypothetical protein
MTDYTVFVQSTGLPQTGLNLIWSVFKNINGDDITPQPSFTEIGGGWYKFSFAGDIGQKYTGVINCGSGVDNKARYIPVDIVENGDEVEASVFITPVYKDGYGVTYYAGLSVEGNRVESSKLKSCTVNLYDDTHSLLKTITTTDSTNGIFLLIDIETEYEEEGYYVIAEITVEGSNKTYKSVETIVVL